MKRIMFFLMIALTIPASALALTAESDQSPDRLVNSRGKIQYNYDIHEVQRDTDGDGQPDATAYKYNYVIVDHPATKQKIMEALRKTKNAGRSFNPADLETEQNTIEMQLSKIATMDYAQIDMHVESTFSGLDAAQKTSLKKLYRAVLALIKQLNLD